MVVADPLPLQLVAVCFTIYQTEKYGGRFAFVAEEPYVFVPESD